MAVLLEIIFQIGCDSQFWKKLLKWSHRRSESPVHLCSRYCVVALIFLFLFNATLFCLIAFFHLLILPSWIQCGILRLTTAKSGWKTAVQRHGSTKTDTTGNETLFPTPTKDIPAVLADGSVGNGWSFVNAVFSTHSAKGQRPVVGFRVQPISEEFNSQIGHHKLGPQTQ